MSKVSLWLKFAGLFFPHHLSFHGNKSNNNKLPLPPREKNSWTKPSIFWGSKCLFFRWGTFWGVRSVLDLSSGTYRKLIFKRMPGRSPLRWLPSVTFGLAGWLCLFPLSHGIPKGDVNISWVRFFRRTRAEGVFYRKRVCVCVFTSLCEYLYFYLLIYSKHTPVCSHTKSSTKRMWILVASH